MTTTPTTTAGDRRRRWLLVGALLAAIALLHLAAVNNHWAIEPDSGLYLSLGRSLAEGHGMEYNGAPSWGVPPLFPALIAGCRLVFGPAWWPLNLLVTLLVLGVAAVSYPLARRLSRETETAPGAPGPLALGVLIIVGSGARLMVDSTRILTDVPCAFFVVLGLYGFIRARQGHWAWCWAGLAGLVAASATRLPAAVFIPGVLAGLALEVRQAGGLKRLVATGGAAAIVVAGAAAWWFLLRDPSGGAAPDYFVTIFERFRFDLWSRWLQWGEGPLRLPGALCEAITGQELQYFNLVPTALIVAGLWTAGRRGLWVIVCPVVVYVGFLLLLGGTAVAPRYLLPVMPMLAWALLVGTDGAARALGRLRGSADAAATAKRRVTALALVVGFCAAVSLPKAVREVVRMHRTDFYESFDRGEWQGCVALGDHLASLRRQGEAAATDRVLSPQPAVLHYLAGLRTDAGMYWKARDVVLGYGVPSPSFPFADHAAAGPWRFVVIPTSKGLWSEEVMARLEATGAFGAPQRFGNLVLYERRVW
ncbi:MAG TPA: phospholipid carrier-dependent glycosyltransferase [Phycisphaerae bacterium]|nr:phospholipid carrier-dependent glycosyltransferase [Phycisphaerae bacterium]